MYMINTTSTTDSKTCITAIDSWPPMSFFFGSDLRCYESESGRKVADVPTYACGTSVDDSLHPAQLAGHGQILSR